MKQTRTTLKELTAMYRAVLRHGILCNAIALGLIATAPAMAERETAADRLVVSGGQSVESENFSWSGFSGSQYGGAVDNSGNLTLTGVEFANNSAVSLGGAIDNYNGEVTINGNSIFSGNSAANGGAVDTDGGKLTINSDVSFNSNSATNGGAIVMSNGAVVNITGASFASNEATSYGGGLLDNGAVVNIKGVIGTDTFKQNSAQNGGGIFVATNGNTSVEDATFKSNTATNNAGAVYNKGILKVTNSNFDSNTSNSLAGAIYNIGTLSVIGSTFDGNNSAQGGAIIDNTEATGGMTITNSTFKNNTATVGTGAIGIFSGHGTTINNVQFKSNSAGEGGALFVGSEATANIINGSVFDSNTATTVGGAISTRSVDAGNNVDAKLDIVGATFSGNSAGTTGGAIDNNFYNSVGHAGSVYVSGTTFGGTGTGEGNSAANGGAIYNHKNATQTGNMYITDTTFAGNSATANGGAIYNEGTLTLNSSTFTGNTAVAGGAIYNDKGTITANGSLFESNNDGAINSDKGTITLTDTSFKNNTGENFGAIGLWNGRNSVVTINAQDADVVFSGNTATDGEGAGDIYNSRGTINLNAAAGRTISMDGGIVGAFGSEKLNINSATGNTGLVDIAANIENHTVNVDAGELHLSKGAADGSNLTDSTVNVASGATINTIDNLVNDYTDEITLKNGALVKGDIDYTAGLADKYSADSGANITYKLANALNLSGVQYGSKEIAITNTGATVNADVNFAWFNGDTGLTLTSGGNGTGTVLVSGVAGGINAAVDATDETVQEITYSANAESETFDGADNVIQNADFSIVGNGSDANSNKIVFENNMIVDEKSTLALNDIVLEKTNDEAIVNQAGGTLNIKDSRIAVNVNNYGTLVSDPTYYDAKVVNAGDATFTEDVFENGSSLTNSATVNLNNVEFVSGSTLTGLAGNVLNVAGTDNKFNGTSTGNNVVLASGADFAGTLSDGVVDARNGSIDTITGSVSGGDLYVDANLNAGTVDTFGGTTGATVKGIKLAGTAYGDDDKVKLTIGEAALDSDVEIDGTNYFTSVVKDGNDIVFSDKLINESNLYKKLGSWNGGNYIATSADMENVADGENYMTVGQALSALDTNLKTVSTAGTIAAGQTGFVTGDAVNTALTSKQDTLTAGSGISLTDDTIAVSGLTTSNLAADADIAKTQLASSVQDSLALADSALQADSELNGANLTAGSVALDKLATKDLSQFDNSTSGFITKDVSDLANYTTTADMNDAIAAAETSAKGYTDTKLADYTTTADMNAAIATAKDEAIEGAKDYVDGKGYQTEDDVNALISSATSGKQDAIVDNEFIVADGNGGLKVKDASVTDAHLADSAVTTAKVANGAITSDKLDSGVKDSLAKANTAVQTVTTGTANGTITVDGTEVAVAGWNTKQDTISDTSTIVKDGTGLKVADGSIGTTQLDSSVNDSLAKANSAVQSVTTGTTNGTISVNGTDVEVAGLGSLAYEDAASFEAAGAAAAAEANAKAYTDARLSALHDNSVEMANAYTDRRIEDLDKNLSAGVAGAVALSAVATSGVERGEVSVGAGYGYFNGQSAAAFGATMGLSNRWSINAGAGISNADVSFRAGTNYKFKLF